jgi:hypothetical protein
LFSLSPHSSSSSLSLSLCVLLFFIMSD